MSSPQLSASSSSSPAEALPNPYLANGADQEALITSQEIKGLLKKKRERAQSHHEDQASKLQEELKLFFTQLSLDIRKKVLGEQPVPNVLCCTRVKIPTALLPPVLQIFERSGWFTRKLPHQGNGEVLYELMITDEAVGQ